MIYERELAMCHQDSESPNLLKTASSQYYRNSQWINMLAIELTTLASLFAAAYLDLFIVRMRRTLLTEYFPVWRAIILDSIQNPNNSKLLNGLFPKNFRPE
jgi:hypothetical protein